MRNLNSVHNQRNRFMRAMLLMAALLLVGDITSDASGAILASPSAFSGSETVITFNSLDGGGVFIQTEMATFSSECVVQFSIERTDLLLIYQISTLGRALGNFVGQSDILIAVGLHIVNRAGILIS